ncbi:aspartyl-tRNA synthetase [Coniophora puteana RWD-64-598 SS2]|uniref:Aspartate--tRNA ligase, cytoplasmic n=1 Tax=Coniophora puteana (strain RWD-64-598) TaxID=741705 RepID=A0A5M3N5H2_CONPW|nr:aspartyl-tRNA synthetase [Coniophora puteana RWD-64-598 SS2]EIW86660.1 aspartyl-tRNA synthetase [Coniophora puteana RWD-64-598 SS2]
MSELTDKVKDKVKSAIGSIKPKKNKDDGPDSPEPKESQDTPSDAQPSTAQAGDKQSDPADGKDGPSKNALKKQAKEAEKAKKKAEKAAKQEQAEKEKAQAEAAEPDYATNHYGELPMHQSQSRPGRARTDLSKLTAQNDGEHVTLRARIQTSRAQGKRMVFLNLRQRTDTVQALLQVTDDQVSTQMVKWATSLADESIVLIEGTIMKAPEPIISASIDDVEIHIRELWLISGLEDRLAFSLEDATRSESAPEVEGQFSRVLLETRLNNRVLDLRTQTNQAIFRLQHGITNLFRQYLNDQGFVEIHSPKLQGAATESGASVFKVDYFKRNAFLAQSPQLAKQMAIAADFERVYEIGPVFRAEDSNTHRHMTEFTGLDLEMVIEEHYHEVRDLLDEMLKSIFRGLREKYSKEIGVIKKQFEADEFKWREGPEGTLILSFKEATDLLVEDGVDRSDLDDINTKNERRLGRIVKEKYDTDYFIVDRFPMELRPFYAMPSADDPNLSNSYDFFMRGEEILSGGQRVHYAPFLEEAMKKKGIDPASMKGYLDGFRLGCPPHGGGGIGLERVLMLYLKLNNIRRASLFPRDPKRLEP